MGSKHRPPRWWRDFDAECAAATRERIERNGDLLVFYVDEVIVGYGNARAIERMELLPLPLAQRSSEDD